MSKHIAATHLTLLLMRTWCTGLLPPLPVDNSRVMELVNAASAIP